MKLTAKEMSVKIYVDKHGPKFTSYAGRGAYIPSIERIDSSSRNGFYIKRKEMIEILDKLLIYSRIEKLQRLNDMSK